MAAISDAVRNTAVRLCLAFALLMTGAVVLAQPTPQGTPLRLLLERLFWLHDDRMDDGMDAGVLLPGALPNDLGFTLPIPSGTELIGSHVTRERGQLAYVTVVIESPLAGHEVTRLYRGVLTRSGWRELPRFSDEPSTGFVAAQDLPSSHFCGPNGKPWLSVNVTDAATLKDPTRAPYIWLDLNYDTLYTPCRDYAPSHTLRARYSPLPPLKRPVGKRFHRPGRSGDGECGQRGRSHHHHASG